MYHLVNEMLLIETVRCPRKALLIPSLPKRISQRDTVD